MNISVFQKSSDVLGRTTNAAPPVRARIADDVAMLRAAADLTRELTVPDPRIYWTDLTVSVLVGYSALAGAMLLPSPWTWLSAMVAVLALYRASSFIHEVSHIKHSALPGFRVGWNAVIGVPMLVPSFMYEGVHTLHHAKTRYGTVDDPEYLPLARMKWFSVPVFVIVAAFAPVALLLRFALITPLAAIFPPVRRFVIAHYSALSTNPAFRRREPEGELRHQMRWQAAFCSIWAMALLAGTLTKVIPLSYLLIYLGVFSAIAIINQVRTLVAHLWENEGEAMSVTAQYLDSVNVPPPGYLPFLWAPVGLRYHALHHLLPGLPYHALGEAHRRLSRRMDATSPFHRANYPGLFGLVTRLVTSTVRGVPSR